MEVKLDQMQENDFELCYLLYLVSDAILRLGILCFFRAQAFDQVQFIYRCCDLAVFKA